MCAELSANCERHENCFARLVMIRSGLIALLFVACSPAPPDQELLDDAEASSAIESTLGKVAAIFVAGDPSGKIEIASPSASCVTTDVAPQRTTFHFASCAGPYGLAAMTGDVQVDWIDSSPTFHVDITSSNLAMGGVAMTSWTASGDVTSQGAARTMIWQSNASGTIDVHGSSRSFQRTVDATSTWTLGTACIDIDGQAHGTIDTSHVDTRASSFVACASSCPNSGSELRADDIDHPGTFVQVTYGSTNASYTNDRGQTFTFVPRCAE